MSTSRTMVFDLAGDIDDTGYAAIRALDGTAIRVEQWNNEASWDSIRHYAFGLGDDNPLFCDPGYAENTPYGTVLAPLQPAPGSYRHRGSSCDNQTGPELTH